MANKRFTHGGRVDNADRGGFVRGSWGPRDVDAAMERIAAEDAAAPPRVYNVDTQRWEDGITPVEIDADAYDANCDERSFGEDDSAERAAYMTDATFAQIERIGTYLGDTRASAHVDKHATEDALHLLWTRPGYGDASDRAMIAAERAREAKQ